MKIATMLGLTIPRFAAVMTTRALPLVALLLTIGGVSPGWAQESGLTDADRHFRVEWAERQTKRGHVVEGYIYNSYSLSAERLRLHVQGLDAQGNVVSTTLAWAGSVPQFNRAYFGVTVPGTAATYRIGVLSVDWGCGGPGGGM